MGDISDSRLVRKIDWHILPPITILYLFSFMDRLNIGQAKLNGLTSTLTLSSSQYNNCVSVFFILYVLCDPLSNLVMMRVRPSLWLPLLGAAWGVTTIMTGTVQTYGELLICRIILGACESGIFPGGCYYVASWYKTNELTWRVSIFFTGSSFAAAFGGLLAYGLSKMDGVGGQSGWRWIFYIEGILTVCFSIIAFFTMYNYPSDESYGNIESNGRVRKKFLTKDEENQMIERLQASATDDVGPESVRQSFIGVFKGWRLYVRSLCYIGVFVPFYSLSFFSPTIIRNLGFDTYKAQLLSVPPYTLAFLTTMTTAHICDKYEQRSSATIFWLIVALICYVILITVEQAVVNYIAVVFAAGALTPAAAAGITFQAIDERSHQRRATALALMIAFSNMGGLISGQIYRGEDAPRYFLGHGINIGFCVVGIAFSVITILGTKFEKRRNDRKIANGIASTQPNGSDIVSLSPRMVLNESTSVVNGEADGQSPAHKNIHVAQKNKDFANWKTV